MVEGDEAIVTREIDGGTETLALKLPAVITADQRLNAPRFVKLPNLMMARKKVIETISGTDMTIEFGIDFSIDIAPRHQLLKVAEPAKRKAGIKVSSVKELLEKLNIHQGIRI